MKSARYHLGLGATDVRNKILMEDMKGLGQRALKIIIRYFFLFGSWLPSKKSADKVSSIGVGLIRIVKTNTKGSRWLPDM